jgi:uncharacterized membrane protein YebE (DUF533 family)
LTVAGETPTQFNEEPDAGSQAFINGVFKRSVMNSDEIGSLVRQVATFALSSFAGGAYMSGSQATAIVGGLAAAASVGYSIYAHWNMKKVPEAATVVSSGK